MDEIQPEAASHDRPFQPGHENHAEPGMGNSAPTEDANGEDLTRKRQEQALMFEKYLEESGLCLSFQIIFTEII